MQAVVKTPHIEISVRGAAIPPKLMNVLREEYGQELSLVEDDGDELVDIFETQWYKRVKEKMKPGSYLRIYRENKGLTQLQLGEALGKIPRQHISNMEHGRRSISLKMARKLSSLPGVPLGKFIDVHEE
jgi:DNA-binding XRE family transcriptional regulator